MTEDSGLGQLALGISTSLGISVTAGVLESRTVFQLMQLSEPLVRWGLVVLFQGVLWSTSHKGTSIFHLLHKALETLQKRRQKDCKGQREWRTNTKQSSGDARVVTLMNFLGFGCQDNIQLLSILAWSLKEFMSFQTS